MIFSVRQADAARAYFAGVAGSYDEKIQRSITEKDTVEGRNIIFKQALIMENKMKIEIWSDIMCPFCYIGKRNFETALSQFANKEQIEIEWKSFQLDPTIPEVPKYQDDMYMFVADRKGFSYEHSKKMHHDLIRYAKSVGLEYNFDKALVTNSLKGHRLIQFAKTKGLGEKAEERLFYAYFTQGKNLSDVATLIELGKEIGLNVLLYLIKKQM